MLVKEGSSVKFLEIWGVKLLQEWVGAGEARRKWGDVGGGNSRSYVHMTEEVADGCGSETVGSLDIGSENVGVRRRKES